MYSLRISTNGQPSINLDSIALHTLATENATLKTSTIAGREYVSGKPHVHVANDGERRVTGITNVDGFRAAIKAAGARTRKTTRCVKVLPPVALVAARDAVEADWQQWAASGMSHAEMQRRAINHPAFRAMAA